MAEGLVTREGDLIAVGFCRLRATRVGNVTRICLARLRHTNYVLRIFQRYIGVAIFFFSLFVSTEIPRYRTRFLLEIRVISLYIYISL